MPVIMLCNGISKTYKRAVSLKKIIQDLYPVTEHKNFIAGSINKKIIDLNTLIICDSVITLIKEDDKKFLSMIRYTFIQLLNYVLKEMWPSIQLAGGKISDSGFFCDFYCPVSLNKSDLKNISTNMSDKIALKYNIIKKKYVKIGFFLFLKKNNEKYKLDIIKEKLIQSKTINICYHEKYFEEYDISPVPNISFCSHFIIKNISGVYWKNNKKKYNVTAYSWYCVGIKNQLLNYIFSLKKFEQRDHRKIAKRLNLYHIQKNSPGMIFWHQNGFIIFQELKKFIRIKLKKYLYYEVKTPIVIDKSLWKKSGHWKFYKNSIFVTKSENQEYCIKPMNCPGHVQIFKQGIKSYKDLPIRIAEFGSCHRNEASGSLHGLMRVRGFTQDDAHIFCTNEQVKTELNFCIKILFELYNTFGFKKITVKFSTRPIQRIGHDKLWDQAEKDLESVLIENKLPFIYQKGEGAFYGPKIEIVLEDSLKRLWQCGTIQLDFYLAKQLKAFYIDKNNIRNFPIIIHRAFLGSIERFIGILIEEYNGRLPVWLSPVHAVVMSISQKNINFVKKVTKSLIKNSIRVISEISENSINFKIRTYVMQYIPYLLICGDIEEKNNCLTIRLRSGRLIKMQKIDDFIKKIKEIIFNRSCYDFDRED
ncbi:threonyl-tRNA synthetase [Buchnera aphidicola (Cinara tujafilina)]|uniref:Threonine--tRNA ligase n=1 Tax=Buchnera aphidicola (Cinara tujafilina) TaxID=261317 RepID=F7WZ21_9GAMM|nr:threonine--tRNA ligase [Buchnera aphidicola]AEH39671.1 threonyl-tRNA synthetase [Buchnera aphidicola (Cinara tujafilina)]